jgi:hypothetical protein
MVLSSNKFNQSGDKSDTGMQSRNSRSVGGGLPLYDVQELCDEITGPGMREAPHGV